MSTNVERAADTAAAVSVPAWLVSIAADAQPVVNVVVGVLTAISLIFVIAVNWKKLKGK